MLTPQNELDARLTRIKNTVFANYPFLHGFFIFSRLNIYYFTGTLAGGVLYVPSEGSPILFVRKGRERAKCESPLAHIFAYRSYSEIEKPART